MSIAVIYERVKDWDLDARKQEALSLIRIELQPYHPDDADMCFRCIRLLPIEILSQARHKFCTELCAIHHHSLVSPMKEWVINGLNGSYERRVDRDLIFATMLWIRDRQDEYIVLPLAAAMLQASMDRQRQSGSTHNIPTTLLNMLSNVLASRVVQSSHETTTQEEKKDSKDDRVIAYCNANNCIRVGLTLPTGEKQSYFLPQDKVSLTLPADAHNDDIACNICMEKKASLHCGNEGCKFEMCETCFHMCFFAKEECPGCRQPYIPLFARQAVQE